MSDQMLALYVVGDGLRSACERDLRAAGFETTRARRVGGVLLGVLVRKDTSDEAEATRIIEVHVPNVRRGPSAVLTHHRVNYRKGR
jgi:hypothetical protein